MELEGEALRDEEREHAVDRGDRESRRHGPRHRADSSERSHRRDREGGRCSGQGTEGSRHGDHGRHAELPPEARPGGGIERDESGDRGADGDRARRRSLERELDECCNPDGNRDEQPAPKRRADSAPNAPAGRNQSDARKLIAPQEGTAGAPRTSGARQPPTWRHEANERLVQPLPEPWGASPRRLPPYTTSPSACW